MIVSGEAYSQRIRTFSDSTMRLILDVKINEEMCRKSTQIVANTDYTEEQVVEKLTELLNSQKK